MNPNNFPFWLASPFETDSSHLPETNALPLTLADLYNLSHGQTLVKYVDLDSEQLYDDKLSDEEMFLMRLSLKM